MTPLFGLGLTAPGSISRPQPKGGKLFPLLLWPEPSITLPARLEDAAVVCQPMRSERVGKRGNRQICRLLGEPF